MENIFESFVKPYTGLFWYIDGNVVGLIRDIDKNANNETMDKHHWEVWNKLKIDYKVNNHFVPYNYFPRGRVYVSKFDGLDESDYISVVDMDKCLDNEEIKEKIIDYFNLYKNSSMGTVFTYNQNHYTCNNCRDDS